MAPSADDLGPRRALSLHFARPPPRAS
jgi:hypothetical protein